MPEQKSNIYQMVRAALNKVERADERATFLSGAAQTAYLKLAEEERKVIDQQVKSLETIRNVGRNTALEILAAIGRLVDEHES